MMAMTSGADETLPQDVPVTSSRKIQTSSSRPLAPITPSMQFLASGKNLYIVLCDGDPREPDQQPVRHLLPRNILDATGALPRSPALHETGKMSG